MTKYEIENYAAVKSIAASLKKANDLKKLEMEIKLVEMYNKSTMTPDDYRDYLNELKHI